MCHYFRLFLVIKLLIFVRNAMICIYHISVVTFVLRYNILKIKLLQIYSDENNTNLDGKEWVECDIDNCGKWVILLIMYRLMLSVKKEMENKILKIYLKIQSTPTNVLGVASKIKDKKK